MQVAIDNAKRSFDIDISSEITRIKKDMEVDKYKYPAFWQGIRKGFNRDRINKKLVCPMNYLNDVKIKEFKHNTSTLPISEFFIKHEFDADRNRKKSKKVEELIQKYSLRLYKEYQNSNNDYTEEDNDNYLLLRNDFDDLINNIRQTYISSNYLPLMSYLINRAFCIGAGVKSKIRISESNTNNNKSILLKTLYEINKDVFMKCFKDTLNI